MLNRMLTPLPECNLKFVGEGNKTDHGVFEGYAATFNNIDSVGDTILPGAFQETIENRSTSVKMFYQHDRRVPVGKWLEMHEDDHGLFVRGELTPGHSVAKDVYASLKHGAIDGLSIGFKIKEKKNKENNEGRILTKIGLVEISPVSLPADSDATILDIKSSEIEQLGSIRECETLLRDAGFSRTMAKAFISQLRPIFQREAEIEREQKKAREADLEWLHDILNQKGKQT